MSKTGTQSSRDAFSMSDMGFGNRTLTTTNLRVRGIAYKMHWSAETVIRRVENSLPSPVEQQVYLEVGLGYRIHPESLKKMLDVFREGDDLRDVDRDWFSVGPNMIKSRFNDVVEKVEQALLLIDKTSDAADYMMSMESAAHLVEAYGDHAEVVLSEIVENLFDVARFLDVKSETPRVIVGVAIKVLVKSLDSHNGSPLPLTVEEMFSRTERRRNE